MKAYQTKQLTGPSGLVLTELDAPAPGPGEIAIALEAATVQLGDMALLSGQRTPQPVLPFIPGMEGAGTVAALGKGVKGFKKGDAVVAFLPSGGFAEVACTRADWARPFDKAVAVTTAAALPHTYAGTLVALRDRAALKADEILLVLGAGGAAGLAAIEIGKLLGARVVAVANGADRIEAAKEQGADDVIDAGNEVLGDALPRLTGDKRANVIFDPVSGDAAIAAFPAGAMGLRYVMAGFAGGQVPRLDPTQIFARDAMMIAANTHRMIERETDRMRKALGEVAAWAADGKIKPRVAAQFPLPDARHAFEYVRARRGMGAVLLTMGKSVLV